jgi:hypothetical protein
MNYFKERAEILKINSDQARGLWKLAEEVVTLRDALEAVSECCTCPDGRAQGPIEAHEPTCGMLIKHKALYSEKDSHG